MINEQLVDTARLEFAVSMMTHHLLVPIFIGLMFMAALLETIFVTSGNQECKKGTKFIGKLMFPTFIIVFVLGVFTPPFAEDWGGYWDLVTQVDNDRLGLIVPSIGMIILLTCLTLFYTCWERLPKKVHLTITWSIPFLCCFSESTAIALNGWMHDPMASSKFNIDSLNYQMTSVFDYFFSSFASLRFFHNFSASFIIGAAALTTLSCYYLIKGTQIEFAKKSILISSVVGFIFAVAVAISGDKQGRDVHQKQPMKFAQIEAIWDTEPGPADLLLFAIPDQKNMKNNYEIKIPYILGWMLNGSTDEPVKGIKDIHKENIERVKNGLFAYAALQQLKSTSPNVEDKILAEFKKHQQDLGYARLLEKYTDDILSATDEQIKLAANDTITNVPVLFFSFRIMVLTGLLLIIVFAYFFYKTYTNNIDRINKNILILSMFTFPISIIGYLAGWIVSEFGRQPWVVYEILPTASGAGQYSDGVTSGYHLSTMLIAYPIMFAILGYLVFNYIRIGPCMIAGDLDENVRDKE